MHRISEDFIFYSGNKTQGKSHVLCRDKIFGGRVGPFCTTTKFECKVFLSHKFYSSKNGSLTKMLYTIALSSLALYVLPGFISGAGSYKSEF